MKNSEIRKLSTTGMLEEINNSTRELLSLRLQRSSGELVKPHLIKQAKKRIARIKTLLLENERKA